MKATDIQIGGNHYKDMIMQPIELINTLGCSFIQGCIIKYISRYKAKNGAQDIGKCIHYAEMAIQLKDRKYYRSDTYIKETNLFVAKNKLTILQRGIIINALSNKYNVVITLCKELLQIEYPEKQ